MSLSTGLLLTEEAPCDAEEVADTALVEAALSVTGATVVRVS
jgi:hypothetical protein